MVPRVFEDAALVRGHQRHRLGDIQRRAAAEADDAIGAVGLEGRHAVVDLLLHRVAEDAAVDGRIQALQRRLELRQHRQRGEALVGDDERALQAAVGEVLGDQLAGAGAEVDLCREGKLIDHG
jgi:hypothetical protein